MGGEGQSTESAWEGARRGSRAGREWAAACASVQIESGEAGVQAGRQGSRGQAREQRLQQCREEAHKGASHS
jgi:hypothetical protein